MPRTGERTVSKWVTGNPLAPFKMAELRIDLSVRFR